MQEKSKFVFLRISVKKTVLNTEFNAEYETEIGFPFRLFQAVIFDRSRKSVNRKN